MFTGLIETLGRIVEVAPRGGSTRLGIASPLPRDELQDGESIAVDGVCLTVSERRGDRFFADVVAETLQRSTLGTLRPGRNVHLERSLRFGARLGGHLVAGHVDTTSKVDEVLRRGDDHRLWLRSEPQIARYLAFKGSVALQGVSLTVASIEAQRFSVVLVPTTLQKTLLGELRPGDAVNVEVDLVARYLERLLPPSRSEVES